MKIASFTCDGLNGWRSRMSKLSFLMLLLWGIGINLGQAQTTVTVNMPSDSSFVSQTITDCSDATTVYQFKDDDSGDGALYSDSDTKGAASTAGPRQDTVEFCPQDQWHAVTATFTEFDVANPDGIRIFDGSRDSLQNLANNANAGVFIGGGTGTVFRGSSVSNINGGWVAASCSPDVNPTGCLTFIFSTDNTNTKGTGWDAWVTCADRNIRLSGNAAGTQAYSVESKVLRCDTSDALPPAMAPFFPFTSQSKRGVTDIAVNRPVVLANCGAINNVNLTLVVKNQSGTECLRTTSNTSQTLTNLPAGIYTAEWFVTSDPTKTTGEQPFSVSLPALVCNDNVEIPLGSACSFTINVDDILENPCDTSVFEFLSYHISIEVGEGKDAIRVGSGTDVASAEPVITKALLQQYLAATGEDLTCGGEARVTIERLYRTPADPINNACSNQNISATCSTIVSFSDQTRPIAQISNIDALDTIYACDASILASMLEVGGIDNCQVRDTTVTIELEETDPCFDTDGRFGRDTTQAFITVTVTDMCGNTGLLRDTAMIIRPTVDMIADPAPGSFECDESGQATAVPGLEQRTFNNGVFSVVDTVELSETEYRCGYILSAERTPLPSTDCGDKEFIVWSVLDWCDQAGGLTKVDTQFVEYLDTKAPFFTDTLAQARMGVNLADDDGSYKRIATANIPLGAFSCTYDINNIDFPDADDNCDDNPTVTIGNVYRIEDGAKWEIPQAQWAALDCDSFCIRWVANDDCHEQLATDQAFQIVIIEDVTKPSAVCTDRLIVSVPNDAGARIHYSDIDAGSTDACDIDSIRIRRKDSDDAWAEYVTIACTDVHNDPQIEMRVWDKKGNFNTCWVDVLPEDKIPPICNNLPNDSTRTCDEFHNGELGMATGDEFVELTGDLLTTYNATFGNPVCEDNLACGPLTVRQYYKLTELNCGSLDIERMWQATDWAENESNTGTQLIHVAYSPNWTIRFPADEDFNCGDEIPSKDDIDINDLIDNGACDLWALEVTDKTFDVPGEICLKVERTYELINWCVYNAGDAATVVANNPAGDTLTSADNANVGRILYTQVLALYVDEAPEISIADVVTCLVGEGDAEPYGVEDLTPGEAPFECDEERTFSASGTNCAGFPVEQFEWKLYIDGVLADEGTGSSFTQVVEPKKIYKVEFWGFDGCGNSAGEEREFQFWDCKNPTPYVLNGLAIELMQTGSVQVWASDLDQGSFDNCTTQDKLDIRIGLGDPTEGPQDLAGVLALGKVVTVDCNNLGTQSVSIYVIDEENNWDVVGTYVLVQDNMNVCQSDPDGMGVVAGKVVNPVGELVQSVNVAVNGGAQNAMITGADGAFEFLLSTGGDYTITPEKDINPLNGVSTYDLVQISKHILGITPFDTPYKYIAADVNKSGSITAFDMVQLRQLILNITSEFPNNSSWRFVDTKYEFTSDNPAAENFNEFMSINNLEGQMLNVDFTAVKIGDINGNATANSLVASEARTTNGGTFNLNVTDRFVEAGQTVNVDFAAANAGVEGYQFTLNFAGLELTELQEGLAKEANFNTNIANRGALTTSWDGEATANEVLFTLKFTAQTSGLLSELVSVSSDITPAEAYNTAGELMNVNIDFTSATNVAGFELSQNTPNPFNGETVIGFSLPQAATATLTVMDVQGKVLRVIDGDFAKGYNQVSLKASELGATGVLYYQLESVDNVATKKMIIIE